MNTVKGLSRLLDKARNKNNPNFQQKREWLSRLTRAMNEQYTFNNLEQAFLGPPILKIEAPTRINVPLDRTRKYKMPAPQSGNFPTLFGKSKSGKTQIWQIEVIKQDPTAVIRVTYGYQDGKQVVNEKEITKGKNLGKKNETTPYEQALLEAQSTWEGKIDGGYAEKLGNAQAPGLASDNAVAAHKTVSPMLAQDYHKQGKKIVFPCYVQAKLDGVRSIFFNNALTSRNGKGFTGLDHIIAELAPATKEGLILDGEVYSTTLTFQQFVGLVKKKTYTAADKEQLKHVNLWVYDCVNDAPFESRLQTLKDFFSRNKFTQIHLLPTEECKSREELKGFHDKYVLEGNEGLMVRNKQGMYQLGARSYDLQKYKEFEDAEYKVTGFTDGQGLEKGLVIWTCETKDGQHFQVRPRGTHEARAEIFKDVTKNPKKYIGKELTVRFQELTGDGIPRFPVGISFRDYE
jgi:DNA ligase-1